MKQKQQKIVTNKYFRYLFLALTAIFIISTFFITLNPKGFIKYGYFGIIFFNIISSGLLLIPSLIKTFNLPLIVLSSATAMLSIRVLIISLAQAVNRFSCMFPGCKPLKPG